MEEGQAFTPEVFIENWNSKFPNFSLTVADLKVPNAVMGALIQVLDRLGIDRDAVLSPPPEENRNEHTIYYWDLLPVINMTRVVNHLLSFMPQVASISITRLLQPTITSSHSVLLLLSNYMLFNEARVAEIAPKEEELFSKTDEVKSLEDRKNRLLEMLNEQAEEKGKRAERLEKFEEETKQLEEELVKEKEATDAEQLELDTILKENHQLEMAIEQKKGLKEALLAEVERKQALRVYDADDIKAKAEQAAQNVQEADENLNSLRVILMEKENSLKNLQTIEPTLVNANNLLNEIMKLCKSLKDSEYGDLDSDSKEGEMEVLNTAVIELEAQLAELQVARDTTQNKRQEAQAQRLQEYTAAQIALRDAEEKNEICREISKKATQRLEEIKQQTAIYEQEKNTGMEDLAKIQNDFTNKLKSIEDVLLMEMANAEKEIKDKLRTRIL